MMVAMGGLVRHRRILLPLDSLFDRSRDTILLFCELLLHEIALVFVLSALHLILLHQHSNTVLGISVRSFPRLSFSLHGLLGKLHMS